VKVSHTPAESLKPERHCLPRFEAKATPMLLRGRRLRCRGRVRWRAAQESAGGGAR
jgi:hypothetical protein